MLEYKDAVIFDLDGTIADSMDLWSEIDREFFAERGMEMPPTLAKNIEGMSFTETAEYFVQTFNLPETVEELKKIWTGKAFDQYAHHIELKPGVREFMDYLKERRMPIGIATSNSKELLEVFLKAQQLEGMIDASVTSDDGCAGKPAPDVYLKAADLLHVKPERCLVFEDITNGILAGKNAHMTVCAVEDAFSLHLTEEKKRLADYYIRDFREALENERALERK